MKVPSKRVLVAISKTYLAILFLCVVALVLIPTFGEVGHLKHGCYLTDALMPYAECRGFIGSSVAKFVLNLPFLVLFLPFFGVAAVLELQPSGLVVIALGLVLWAPIAYLAWHGFRLITTCVFRAKPVQDSVACRSSIPPHVGPRFRVMSVQ